MTDSTPPQANNSERHHYIDALRVMAVLLLLVFHTGLMFTSFYHFVIESKEKSIFIATFAVAFLHLWHMPLFFLISGMSAWFALGKRTGWGYFGERVKRVLLPFVWGFFVLIPPQVYYDVVSRGRFGGSYFEFYPYFFTPQLMTWHHLWFILYLFAFSVVALPLFVYLRGDKQQAAMKRLADFIAKPGAIFLMPLPIMISEVALRARWPGYYNLVGDWANFTMFLAVFVYGFILVSDQRIIKSIRHQWKIALGLAIPITAALLAVVWITEARPTPDYADPFYYLYTPAAAFAMWLWVVAWLGFGHTYLNKRTAFLNYASEIAYPFYILHQTVLVAIAYYVLQWEIGIAAKFVIIAASTLVITAGLCEIVKLTNVTRFLFGVKSKH